MNEGIALTVTCNFLHKHTNFPYEFVLENVKFWLVGDSKGDWLWIAQIGDSGPTYSVFGMQSVLEAEEK